MDPLKGQSIAADPGGLGAFMPAAVPKKGGICGKKIPAAKEGALAAGEGESEERKESQA